MRKQFILILIVVVFVLLNLQSEITFYEYSTLPQFPGRYVGLQLFDVDNDNIEEFFIISDSMDEWMLTCYSSNGDTLFTHTFFESEPFEEYIYDFDIVRINEVNYLVSISNHFSNIFLRIFDLETFSVISELNICNISASPYNIVGDFFIHEFNGNYYIVCIINQFQNQAKIYKIEDDQISYIQSSESDCKNIIFDNFQYLYYSTEYDKVIDYYIAPHGYYESYETNMTYLIKSYIPDPMFVVDSLFSITGISYWDSDGWNFSNDFPVEFRTICGNFSVPQDTKQIVFFRVENGVDDDYFYNSYLKCFNADFSTEYWNVELNDVSQNNEVSDIKFITNITINQCIYLLTLRYNNIVELRSKETGELLVSNTFDIDPFALLIDNYGEVYFVEEGNNEYIVYSVDVQMNSNFVEEILNIATIKNYPNPFNPSTAIEFNIEPNQQNEQITLEIYNIKGQKIRQFKMKNVKSKMNKVIWNGDDEFGNPVSSGIYLYQLNIDGKTEAVRKCLLLK